jgi:shikimate dehydrogenase
VLSQLGILFKTVVRNKVDDELQYEELTEQIIAEHTLIINTTPLGMLPLVNTCPAIPYQYLGAKHLCYDLVYNPAETLFLTNAKAKGAQIKNGMEMLVLQAERSWYIWNL